MNKLLDLEDVCQRYRISKWTLYQWTSKGLIPHLKIGGKILFREIDIEEWEQNSFKGEPRLKLI